MSEKIVTESHVCGITCFPGSETCSGCCTDPNVNKPWTYEVTAMDFGKALKLLKEGKKVARLGWNGKNMFLFLVSGSTFQVNRPPLLGIYPEGTEIQYSPHIDMKTADGKVVPWLASQTDMLAEDWIMIL